MNDKKLFFFDIDSTYVAYTTEGSSIPESASSSVARLRELGNLCCIASGRPKKYIDALVGKTFDGMVGSNGNYIENNGIPVFQNIIAPERIKRLLDVMESLEIGYSFTGNEKVWGRRVPEERLMLLTEMYKDDPEYYSEDWNPDEIEPASLELFYKTSSQIEKCKEILGDEFIVNIHNFFYVNHYSADISFSVWNKGDACMYLAKHLGIPRENTYAFGDGLNDVEMLKMVKYGIAMGNGADEAKKAAYYVTANCWEDGIYKALVHLNLI